MGKLTTHVLDTAHGCPAADMQIQLWQLEQTGQRNLLITIATNADGRTDVPLLLDTTFVAGRYELVFAVGDYFAAKGTPVATIPFLDRVPIQFGIADASSHYHVPLLVSPWAYSTYRGS